MLENLKDVISKAEISLNVTGLTITLTGLRATDASNFTAHPPAWMSTDVINLAC